MADKYVAFIPKDWSFQPDQETVERVERTLLERGILQESPEGLTNGPAYKELWRDPDPRPASAGEGHACDPGKMRARIDHGKLRGYSGDNLTPVACGHCESELPYEEACDAFIALAEGEPQDSPRLQLECYHCGKHSPALGADYGQSAGFSHFALVFEGETSNRVEPVPKGMELLEQALGRPVTFIQVHGW